MAHETATCSKTYLPFISFSDPLTGSCMNPLPVFVIQLTSTYVRSVLTVSIYGVSLWMLATEEGKVLGINVSTSSKCSGSELADP